MIQQFLQKKIAQLLGQFVQFQKNKLFSVQGLTLTKSKIKPKLIDMLSQVLGMPLQLNQGIIQEVKFNMPWQKLFLMNASSIKLCMKGLKIKTKLRNRFNYTYNSKSRQGLIKYLTNQLISSDEKTSPLVKKLKQYFMDTLQLEISDIDLQIQVDLQQKIQLIFAFESVTARQEHKTNTLKINGQKFSINYKVANSKPEVLLYPTNMYFTRRKQQKGKQLISEKLIQIEKIHLNVNNNNFNDIRRFLCLVSWHNSFMHLPVVLWRQKPLSIIKTKPVDKLRYYSKLLVQNIRDRNLKKTLQQRKIYNILYTQILKGSKDFAKSQTLSALQDKMYIWKIVAYRNFCIQKLKEETRKKNQQIERKIKLQQIPQKDISLEQKNEIVKAENKLNGFSWMKSWFRTENNQKQLIDELQEKLNKLETVPTISILNLTIKQIVVNVAIITYTAKQNFLLAKALQINYKYQFYDQGQIQKHEVILAKFKIAYEDYLGHQKKYAYLLETIKQGEINNKLQQIEDSQEQFEEVDNFLEFRNFPQYQVRIEPVKICINHQILQRLSVFDIQSFQKCSEVSQMKLMKHIDPYLILRQMNKSFSHKLNSKYIADKMKQISKCENIQNLQEQSKYIYTGILVIIPQQMARQLCPCNQIVLQIKNIQAKFVGQTKKMLDLKDISLKFNFPQENNQNYSMLLGISQYPIKSVQLIRSFDLTYFQKNTQSQNRKQIDVQIKQSITINLESPEDVCNFIKLLHHLKPVSKESKNLYRMRMRRKQSIGEEFIDACQNLNEHIVKSTISTTEIKIKKYSPIIQNRQQQITLKTSNIKIKMQQAVIEISPLSFDRQNDTVQGSFLCSQSQKNINFQIYQIKIFSQYISKLVQQIKKVSSKIQQSSAKPSNQDDTLEQKKDEIQVSNFNFKMSLFHQKVCFLKIETNKIKLRQQLNQLSVELQFLIKYKNNSKKQLNFSPLIENTNILFIQKKQYNSFIRQLLINDLTIDFTPQLFKFLIKIYKIYLESLQNRVKIQNKTLNNIKINLTGNRYLDFKPFQTQNVGNERDCNMIIFGNKIQLNLANQFQTHVLTQNCCIIKAQRKLKYHTLESNIKLVNLQDRTIWVNIGQRKNEQMYFPPKTNEMIDVKYLSTAKSFDLQLQQSQRPRGTSIHKKGSDKFQLKGQKINMPLKPKQEYNLLINDEEHCFQIFDQGIKFKMLKFSDILKQQQIILNDEQDQQYLIVRCAKSTSKFTDEFRIQILSPIYIVNKLPWRISYRLGTQAFDMEQIVNSQGRVIRKRSFQAVPIQKIMPLEHHKIRSILYKDIFDLNVTLDEFSGVFKLSNIIQEMKKKKGFQLKLQESTLICLSNGKKNLQIILKLQISQETLKIKLYPEYVFVNLCEMSIFFKIKESEYTYPELKLKTIKETKKNPANLKNQQQIQSFVKTYIGLTNQKYEQKQILKQLFEDFEDRIEIFAGSINKKIKRYFVYESGTRLTSSNSGSGYNSTGGGGYTSGYGSGSDTKQHEPHYNTSQLTSDSMIYYGSSKSHVYYRNLRLDEYFNLVIFIPTIKIINKSASIFMVKSKANKTLLKIQGQQMNYLTVNAEGFSVQAIDQNEEVNLNEWFNINIQKLGTVYYAKQLSSNGYESKEYTLRKKKLRKRPKIFYRIVLSQHQRGIQVLIQQSQYPPISFINKTHLKLKIQEENQAFQQELGPNEMAEFACIKNPYNQPLFKLFYAEHYEYLFVQKFYVDQFKTIPCSKSSKFIISVEEFKDKKIVIFGDQKLLQMSQIKNQMQIQKVERFLIRIDNLLLSFMNQFYKQFSAFKVSELEFQLQQKNDKQYYKLRINDAQGFDFSGIQPEFTFHKVKQEASKDMFRSSFKAPPNIVQNKAFFNSNIIISYHKNATIVEKCHIRLAPIKIIFNSYLLIQSIKVYQDQTLNLFNLLTMYSSSQSTNKKQPQDSLMKRQFIFESFVWQETSVTLKCQNLNIICLFLDKNYYKWIIRFLQWVGDLKPIKFSHHYIEYQNYTIQKLIKKIDVKKKAGQFAKILIQYPLRQLLDISSVFIGQNQKSSIQKARIIFKLFRGLGKIIFNSGFVPTFSKLSNKNLEDHQKFRYREQFQETHSIVSTQTMIDKINDFQYAEWKYEQNYYHNRLNFFPIQRLERYNLKNEIISYDPLKSRIKVALDSYHGNKIHRPICFVQQLNLNTFLGLSEEFFVLYFKQKEQWKIKKHQQVISIQIILEKTSKNGNQTKLIKIVVTTSTEQSEFSNQKINLISKQSLMSSNKSRLEVYKIPNPWITQEKLKELKEFIRQNKLITEF